MDGFILVGLVALFAAFFATLIHANDHPRHDPPPVPREDDTWEALRASGPRTTAEPVGTAGFTFLIVFLALIVLLFFGCSAALVYG